MLENPSIAQFPFHIYELQNQSREEMLLGEGKRSCSPTQGRHAIMRQKSARFFFSPRKSGCLGALLGGPPRGHNNVPCCPQCMGLPSKLTTGVSEAASAPGEKKEQIKINSALFRLDNLYGLRQKKTFVITIICSQVALFTGGPCNLLTRRVYYYPLPNTQPLEI